jgi:3-isopropylmalate/(R)-2-methylmalate dehydratase large subunit
MAQTLFDKIWDKHVVCRNSGFPDILYIDTHFITKETSPLAFEALRKRSIAVLRVKQTIVVPEPEYTVHFPSSDLARFQVDLLNRNCTDFGIELPQSGSLYRTGMVAYPGQTLVCDANQAENLGAFGVLAIGITETQVEQVLATQCLLRQKPKRMKIEVNGKLGKGLGVKDINHHLISEISAQGARGYFVEFDGDTIRGMDMNGRMSVCNMSQEIGAIGGIIAPDKQTLAYLKELGIAPENLSGEEVSECWKELYSDEASVFDEVLEFDAEDIRPGNYDIGISKLIRDEGIKQNVPTAYEMAGILEGYNDTEYILNQRDSIEEFEESLAYKTVNG